MKVEPVVTPIRLPGEHPVIVSHGRHTFRSTIKAAWDDADLRRWVMAWQNLFAALERCA